MDVTGKTILITGSSEGIGAECARLFSKSGANLVLVARTKSKLEEIAEEIRNDCKVLLVPMDISDTRSCKKLISKTSSDKPCKGTVKRRAGALSPTGLLCFCFSTRKRAKGH